MSAVPEAISAGATLLVVGDADPKQWSELLKGSEVAVQFAATSDDAARMLREGRVDVAYLVDGTWLSELKAADEEALILVEDGNEAADRAAGVVPQPLTRAGLLYAVRTALLLAYSEDATIAKNDVPQLLGESRAMRRVRDMVARSAGGNATVLIRGETGTGKELVARAIHAASERAAGPLVVLHCAALPDSLLESELFGYEAGAFTGATKPRVGRVELADKGTLFLDEIGEITLATQVKLLRLVQDREFQRLGSNTSRRVDVRFVAATHRQLDEMVAEGTFREDLFYRLNVVPLWVPPLRARKGDVAVLARAFVRNFNERDKKRVEFSDEALERLDRQRWPGNVRQLQNFIERLVVLNRGGVIGANDVEDELHEGSPFVTGVTMSTSIGVARPPEQVVPLDEAIRIAEKNAILGALKAAENNRSLAARLLGVSRATLYNKLKELNLP